MSTRGAHLCTCGHSRDMHSYAREDDFGCLVIGCSRCRGFERAVAGKLDPAEHVRRREKPRQ